MLPGNLLRRIRSTSALHPTSSTEALCAKASGGDPLDEAEIAELFTARGDDVVAVSGAGETLVRPRVDSVGVDDTVPLDEVQRGLAE